MARRDPIKRALEQLARHAQDPFDPESLAGLRSVFRDGHSIVVARAARIVREHGISELLAELALAFTRFIEAPALDKQCSAKKALAETLDQLEYERDEPFLAGIQHQQMEAVFGGYEDTAAPVRARCAAALVRLDYPGIHRELARLLFDRWSDARLGAARATAYLGGALGEIMLRMKLEAGDREPAILGECMLGLMQVAGDESIDLVRERLHSGSAEIAEQAALALGESRHPRALACLLRAWDEGAARRSNLLLPIALLRSQEAFEHLLRVCCDAQEPLAAEAVAAMSAFLVDEERRSAARRALEVRGNRRLLELLDAQSAAPDPRIL